MKMDSVDLTQAKINTAVGGSIWHSHAWLCTFIQPLRD
jgi:hypothetical protein